MRSLIFWKVIFVKVHNLSLQLHNKTELAFMAENEMYAGVTDRYIKEVESVWRKFSIVKITMELEDSSNTSLLLCNIVKCNGLLSKHVLRTQICNVKCNFIIIDQLIN